MEDYQKINQLVEVASRIVIIQADNPDADSLGSALALESILGDLGKEPIMYCALDMPVYLRHMQGWDRVQKEIPPNFDLSIIVDASTVTLLEKLENSAQRTWMPKHPCIVLDHHSESANDIPYATVVINDSNKVSAGELIYSIAKELKWPLNLPALEYITNSILSDSMGLSTENTTASTYRVMAELVEAGVDRPKLEELRRAINKMDPRIFRYKADLIKRTELLLDGKLALLVIPQNEINEFSPLYNPGPLVQGDQLQTEGVLISVVIKSYDNGRITGAIRSNHDAPIASDLAKHFGGGGHSNAAGFKLDNQLLTEVKSNCIKFVEDALRKLETHS